MVARLHQVSCVDSTRVSIAIRSSLAKALVMCVEPAKEPAGRPDDALFDGSGDAINITSDLFRKKTVRLRMVARRCTSSTSILYRKQAQPTAHDEFRLHGRRRVACSVATGPGRRPGPDRPWTPARDDRSCRHPIVNGQSTRAGDWIVFCPGVRMRGSSDINCWSRRRKNANT